MNSATAARNVNGKVEELSGVLNAHKPSIDQFPSLVQALVKPFLANTEADPFAIALQLMIALGNWVGRQIYIDIGEMRHYLNEFLLLIGSSSRGRKGESKHVGFTPFAIADPNWLHFCVRTGVSSAEGIVFHLGDPAKKDEGVLDKRMCLYIPEMASLLRLSERSGNTISEMLRDCWDSPPRIQTLTKNSPLYATAPHLSVISHSTLVDLDKYFTERHVANGFGNRFLIVYCQRAKMVPNPKPLPPTVKVELGRLFQNQLAVIGQVGEMVKRSQAEQWWVENYPEISRENDSLVGILLNRSEAHLVRLAALCRLFRTPLLVPDGPLAVDVQDFEFAWVIWRYMERCIEEVFGDRTGDRLADRIYEKLAAGPMTFTEISTSLGHHVSAPDLHDAVTTLCTLGLVTQDVELGDHGRHVVVVRRTDQK